MNKYKIHIAYDGTKYSGWQLQHNAITIQEVLERGIGQFLQEDPRIIGSGRTDAGVHAMDQVAHFTTGKTINEEQFLHAASSLLPKDIRITKIEKADDDFHAQYSAKRKEYHYHFTTNRFVSPFRRYFCTHFKRKIDLGLLKNGTKKFIGTHDFTSFANSPNEGSAAKNSVRTIYRIDIIETENEVRLEFEGNGFLYKMVRNIVGTLIDVASSKIPLEEIDKIFTAKDRRAGPIAAPPQGLFLVKVSY